jgi:pimeloyl-ACP methyl ester carboxylesterase
VDGEFGYRENGPASQFAPLLAEHFTVFAYDRRGRGASGDAPVLCG